MKRGQYFFTLPDIDFIKDIVNVDSTVDMSDTLDTRIDFEHVPVVDVHEQLRTTMYDIIEQKILPLVTDKECWWCRYTFLTAPIGCPLNYVKKGCPEFFKYCDKKNLALNGETDYFETEGIFCGFRCCKAYICDNIHKPKYKESGMLLSLLYYKLTGKMIDEIVKASHWQVLRKNQGYMDIEVFRGLDPNLFYQITPNVKRPFMFTMGHYIQKLAI